MHEALSRYLWSVIGRDLVAVKATLFDKTASNSWRVQWHQDRTIAVKERMNLSGYGPWSTKAGSLHVEPPAEVLAQMLAVRVHLDPCGLDNGPLRVLPGTHLLGKLPDAKLAAIVASTEAVELDVPQGGIVLMRPLLVHSSTPPRTATHRRVLHIEFAPAEAISPLQWGNAVAGRRGVAVVGR